MKYGILGVSFSRGQFYLVCYRANPLSNFERTKVSHWQFLFFWKATKFCWYGCNFTYTNWPTLNFSSLLLLSAQAFIRIWLFKFVFKVSSTTSRCCNWSWRVGKSFSSGSYQINGGGCLPNIALYGVIPIAQSIIVICCPIR